MTYKVLGFLLISTLLTSCFTDVKEEQTQEDTQASQLDSLLAYSHDNGMFNGSIAVLKDDAVVFKKSYGMTGADPEKSIDPETIFYIASISKQFTAMATMILQERGLLGYNDPVSAYFPELKSIPENATIKNLLQHTSGISDRAYYQLEDPNNQDVLNQLISIEATSFGLPNQRFSYSNTGYVLLALIVERVSETTIEDFLQKEIFDPLAMTRTTTSKEKWAADNNRAYGYSILGEPSTYSSSVVGPGGIYSTINDLLKWNAGINKGVLVSNETRELAFANGTIEEGPINFKLGDEDFGYGFGWMPFKKGNDEYVRHDGSTEGFRSLIRKNLSQNIDVVLLTNHGGTLAMDEITNGIDEILETQSYTVPDIPLPNRVMNKLKAEGIASVVEMLHGTLDLDNKPDESVLGRLSYTLQNNDRLEEAIELYKVNLALYPESANALYILGEAYLTEEKYELAKEVYDQFLAVSPDSDYVKGKLELIDSKLKGNN